MFQERIKQIVKQKFGSQKNMAETLNIDPSNVSGWVRGKGKPSFDVLEKLGNEYNISLDWLILGKNWEEDFDHHDFAKTVAYTHDWAKANKIESNDSFLVTIFLTYNRYKTTNPNLTLEDFLEQQKEIFKNIKFYASDEDDGD